MNYNLRYIIRATIWKAIHRLGYTHKLVIFYIYTVSFLICAPICVINFWFKSSEPFYKVYWLTRAVFSINFRTNKAHQICWKAFERQFKNVDIIVVTICNDTK